MMQKCILGDLCDSKSKNHPDSLISMWLLCQVLLEVRQVLKNKPKRYSNASSLDLNKVKKLLSVMSGGLVKLDFSNYDLRPMVRPIQKKCS